MTQAATAGARFRAALKAEKPLQIIGAINAYHAMLAAHIARQAAAQAAAAPTSDGRYIPKKDKGNFMARLRDTVQAEHSAGGAVFIARVANLAASIVVGKLGTAVVTHDELQKAL